MWLVAFHILNIPVKKGVSSVHFLMDLAEKYNCLMDVHCDEIDPASRAFGSLADEAHVRGMGNVYRS